MDFQLGRHRVTVATDSRKAARQLEAALAEHLVDQGPSRESETSFLLNRPRALQRSHVLSDRTGVVLSSNRGLESGVVALAGHLAAFLSPPDNCVRLRARVLATSDRAMICFPPIGRVPQIDESELARAGIKIVDRLAIDYHTLDHQLVLGPLPWPGLAELQPAETHFGSDRLLPVSLAAMVVPWGSVAPTRASLTALLVAAAVEGEPQVVLEACGKLAQRAEIRSLTSATDTAGLVAMLRSPKP